jgi:S1-C subfamily serine protease
MMDSFKILVLWLFLLGQGGPLQANQLLPATIAKIKPSIVAVGTFMPRRSPRAIMLGTGFVIADGSLVVTNAHVLPKQLDVEHIEKMIIFFKVGKNNKMADVDTLVVDEEHDIAILKIKEGKLPALLLGDTKDVREGQLYAFTGFPIGMVLGLFPVTHQGIVSAISPIAIPVLRAKQLNRKMMQRLSNPFKVFQLDATAYPGNSGSPLYDAETGAVIGVINKVFVKESKEKVLSKPSGITYAIPIEHVKELMVRKGLLK